MKLLLISILSFFTANVFAVEVDQTQYKNPSQDELSVDQVSDAFNFERLVGFSGIEKDFSLSNSADILRFIENTLIIGRRAGDNDLALQFGHYLLQNFYYNTQNTTQFNEYETTYLPAALGFEGEKIWNYFKTIGSDENRLALDVIFNCTGQGCHKIIWPEEKPVLRPVKFVESIRSYLVNTVDVFRSQRVSEDFVGVFKAQIEKDYLASLDASIEKIKTVNETKTLRHNISTVIQVISTFSFLPPDIITQVVQKLTRALQYADLMETEVKDEPYAQRILRVIANIWLDLTPEQRELYIKPANETLYSRLKSQSDVYLKFLAKRSDSLGWSGSGYIEYADAWTFDKIRSGYMRGLSQSCHERVYKSLVNWISMSSDKKNEFEKKDSNLHSIFSKLKEKDIRKDLLTEYIEKEKRFDDGTSLSERFIVDIEYICLSDVQKLLDSAINKYALSELDEQIRQWGPKIEEIVAAKTLANVAAISQNVKSAEDFEAYFKKMAFPIMKDMLFKGKTINGLERSTVNMKVLANGRVEIAPYSTERFETGAETIGVSLAASYQRFKGLDKIEGKSAASDEYARVVFSQINKMLSVIGFRNFDKSIYTSLHRRFWGPKNDLDVFKYDCSPLRLQRQQNSQYAIDWRENCTDNDDYYLSNFQLPDRVFIEGAFTPKDSEIEYYSSVASQAELIRGSSLMLKYFQDWKGVPDDFDLGMGSRKMGAISVFPRSAFVNLSVGVVTMPIRGFKKPSSPIRLFNVETDEEVKNWVNPLIDVESLKKSENPAILRETLKGVVHVAYTDQKATDNESERLSQIVRTKDMAMMIIAFDEFLSATEGIKYTGASVINPKHKKVEDRENLKALLEGRELLSKMMVGMAFFVLGRTQDIENGGFYAGYDLVSKSVIKEKKLLDQIYMIEALLRVFARYKGQGYWINAVETYYFMNREMWDAQAGFYKFDKDDNAKAVTFLKVINMLTELEAYIPAPESKNKLNLILETYKSAYYSWIRKAMSSPAPAEGVGY